MEYVYFNVVYIFQRIKMLYLLAQKILRALTLHARKHT